MSARIVYLKSPEQPPAAIAAPPSVMVGRRYQLDNDVIPEDLHGLCGGLDYNADRGHVLAPSPRHCYLWDIDDELTSAELALNSADAGTLALTSRTNILTSRFVLSHSRLSEPQIINLETAPQLTTTAGFGFVFSTNMPAVHLGLLNLVETRCFAVLRNGQRHSIRDRGETRPVLYLDQTTEGGDVVMPVMETAHRADAIQHQHDITISQAIPEWLAGSEVETLTVLEQYTSFFLQRESPFSQENIWTPVCAAIAWGWSMRVARRHDGDWCIVRQKLLIPSVGHNGLELPAWEGNQLTC